MAPEKDDFVDWVSAVKQESAPYTHHPMENETIPRVKLPEGKYRIFYKQFKLADENQARELQDIVTLCISDPHWVLAREEWSTDQQGNRIITLKYMNFEPAKKKKD